MKDIFRRFYFSFFCEGRTLFDDELNHPDSPTPVKSSVSIFFFFFFSNFPPRPNIAICDRKRNIGRGMIFFFVNNKKKKKKKKRYNKYELINTAEGIESVVTTKVHFMLKPVFWLIHLFFDFLFVNYQTYPPSVYGELIDCLNPFSCV